LFWNEGQMDTSKICGLQELFNTQGALRKLISDDKISLIDNNIWYVKDDTESIEILQNYFSI